MLPQHLWKRKDSLTSECVRVMHPFLANLLWKGTESSTSASAKKMNSIVQILKKECIILRQYLSEEMGSLTSESVSKNGFYTSDPIKKNSLFYLILFGKEWTILPHIMFGIMDSPTSVFVVKKALPASNSCSTISYFRYCGELWTLLPQESVLVRNNNFYYLVPGGESELSNLRQYMNECMVGLPWDPVGLI